ncbi:MAG: MMPL family transporter [Deltaproteobacteria bacterium]|nr:MMPL family transporter [Deltaproteobacteria bacterium]
MGLFDIFGQIYLFFSKRRQALFVISALVILLSLFYLTKIRFSEDIKSLLPDSREDFLLEFNLLQQTPFMHKVIINLRERSGADKEGLTDAADDLAKAISASQYFTSVTSGPVSDQNFDIYTFIVKSIPNLITRNDLEEIRGWLTPGHVHEKLLERYTGLFSPEGSMMIDDIRLDPLDIKTLVLKKLSSLNIIPEGAIKKNHFIDQSGRNLLLIADTCVDVTDTLNAERMLAELEEIKKKALPENLEMLILSPQSYTVTNTRAIKKDLVVVLSISSLSMIILFFLFLKNWRAIFILLISFSSFTIALGGVSVIYSTISAITIGFGSVLLGLSDDLSLHVYFALRRDGGRYDAGHIMSEVSRPVLYGGLIIICSLSLLLLSELPGQRQLGLFSIIGVITSLVFTLVLLPQMMRATSSSKEIKSDNIILVKGKTSRPILYISLWIIMIIACFWSGKGITFDGDLNNLNYRSDELKYIEGYIKRTWGDFNSRAMIFSEGDDLESALMVNESLYNYIKDDSGKETIISIAPVLPSIETQRSNIDTWKSFWSENKNIVTRIFENEGSSIGFTPDAFDPFIKSLDESPDFITPDTLNRAGISALIDSLIIPYKEKIRILTLAPDNERIRALLKASDCPGGVRFVSQGYIGEMIRKTVGHDFVHFIAGALIVILVLLIPLFRDFKKVMLSMVPVVTGVVFMFGIMGLFDIAFNIFNVISSILLIGLGIDYGIFMVCRCSEDYEHDTDTAVLLSGLTTVTGFGALIFASHPALYSIGITVLLGIGAAIPSAIYVIPALYHYFDKGGKKVVSL